MPPIDGYRTSFIVGAILQLAGCGGAPPPASVAVSEEPTGAMATRNLRPAFAAGSEVHIRTGFAPDPLVIRGNTDARAALSVLSAECVGMATSEPTQRVTLESRFGFLRVFATSSADLTLAVRTADGAVLCSDDRFGRHPSIEGRFAPGELEIWVGQRAEAGGTDAPVFELELTEARSVRPGVRRGEELDRLALAVEAGLDVEIETGRDGDLRLRRGFLPDPRHLEGQTVAEGDHAEVEGLSETCAGFVTPAPSHVLNLQEDFDFLQLYFEQAHAGTVLIVMGPDGAIACDTTEGETPPELNAAAWPAGRYRIWVGTSSEEASYPYRLSVSEIRRAR